MTETRLQPDLQRVADAIERAVDGLTPQQLGWQPEGKWSAANILEHLSITYGGTARVMKKAAERGASLATRASGYQRLAAFVVTGIGFLPGGRKAPEMTVPTGLAANDALAAIRRNLVEMDAAFAAAGERLPGNRPVADHPVLGPLTLRQWRRFHWVHTRHHMKQIAALREQLRG
jgi:hypothetical protein